MSVYTAVTIRQRRIERKRGCLDAAEREVEAPARLFAQVASKVVRMMYMQLVCAG